MDDNFVPDFILPEAGCCRYGCSDGFLNSRAVGFEDRGGWSIVSRNKADIVVGGELYGSNKGFLNCRVDSIAYCEVVGVVRKSCAISLKENGMVAFGQNKRGCLLAC